MRFFARMEAKGLSLSAIKSYHVSGYLAELTLTGKNTRASTPTVVQHLPSLRMLFDSLIRASIDANPAIVLTY